MHTLVINTSLNITLQLKMARIVSHFLGRPLEIIDTPPMWDDNINTILVRSTTGTIVTN